MSNRNNNNSTDMVDINDDTTTNMKHSHVDADDDDNNDDDDQQQQEQEEEQRYMNDTTMPPPPSRQRQQQQQKKPSSSYISSSASISKSRLPGHTGGIVTKSAAEIALSSNSSRSKGLKQRTGFGLSDWTHLLSVTKDIVQLKGQSIRHKIQWEEIQNHTTIHDGWIVLYDHVYNLTPYIPYHPGGSTILKSILGNDATTLFNKYHRWVNFDGYVFVNFVVFYIWCGAR
jgi:cytochrome b involved in lipid metabolism